MQKVSSKVVVSNLHDIRSVISSSKKPMAKANSSSVKIGSENYIVDHSTNHPSYLQQIKDGIVDFKKSSALKEPIVIGGKELEKPKKHAPRWIGELVKTHLGGVLEDWRIRWDLKDGTYFFDPITEKLTKNSSD